MQAKLAEIIEKAGEGFWKTIDGRHDFSKKEFVEILRGLSQEEVEAAVAIAYNWKVGAYKRWENELARTIRFRLKVSEPKAMRIIRTLEFKGFLSKATDLDYSRPGMEQAYAKESLLLVLSRLAQQSGLFDFLPKPEPYALSEFLIYEGYLTILSEGWSAGKFNSPRTSDSLFAVVTRDTLPKKSWLFESSQDNSPKIINESWERTPIGPTDSMDGWRALSVRLSLEDFDTLGVLK